MPPEKTTEKKALFGVYQGQTGSYTIGEYRFVPGQAVAAPPDVAAKACDETSPVRFFETKEAAQAEIGRLKAEAERKRPKKA